MSLNLSISLVDENVDQVTKVKQYYDHVKRESIRKNSVQYLSEIFAQDQQLDSVQHFRIRYSLMPK